MSLTQLTLGRLGQKLKEETQSVALEMLLFPSGFLKPVPNSERKVYSKERMQTVFLFPRTVVTQPWRHLYQKEEGI